MDFVRNIDSFTVLKILSDPTRMAITRMLMKSPATLSQLGQSLGMSPARIRHHLVKLIDADLVELVQEHPPKTAPGLLLELVAAEACPSFLNLFLGQAPQGIGPQGGTGFLSAQGVPRLFL